MSKDIGRRRRRRRRIAAMLGVHGVWLVMDARCARHWRLAKKAADRETLAAVVRAHLRPRGARALTFRDPELARALAVLLACCTANRADVETAKRLANVVVDYQKDAATLTAFRQRSKPRTHGVLPYRARNRGAFVTRFELVAAGCHELSETVKTIAAAWPVRPGTYPQESIDLVGARHTLTLHARADGRVQFTRNDVTVTRDATRLVRTIARRLDDDIQLDVGVRGFALADVLAINDDDRISGDELRKLLRFLAPLAPDALERQGTRA